MRRRVSRIALALAWWLASTMSPACAALIAIDVGHYLEKPGAISARGRPEFEFNLDLAREIDTEIKSYGHKTRLIGDDGRIKELWRRPRAARGADVLISVHHDSVQERYLSSWRYEDADHRYSDMFSGFSIFVSRENAGWRKGLQCASAVGAALIKAGFRPSLYHADPVYGENRPFADKAHGVHFYDHLAVLRRADMPALLFEAGVIVHREQEITLRDSSEQKKMAASVALGIAACLG